MVGRDCKEDLFEVSIRIRTKDVSDDDRFYLYL